MSDLSQPLKNYWSINWLRRSIISIISLVLILLILPIAAQYTIAHLLQKQGAQSASIEDVNFNPFAGTFELKQLNFSVADIPAAQIDHLSIDLSMLELLKGRFVVNDVQISNSQILLKRHANGEIFINGLPVVTNKPAESPSPPAEEAELAPLKFALNTLELKNIEVSYQEPDFEQHSLVQSLSLKNIKSWDNTAPADLELDMLLNQGPVRLSAQLLLFDEIRSFSGKASVQSLDFSHYAKFYRPHIDSVEGQLNIDAEFDVAIAENISATISPNIEINRLNADYRHVNLSAHRISWEGAGSLQEDGSTRVKGNLVIEQSSAQDTEQDYRIASFDKLSASGFTQQSKSIALDQLELDGLLFAHTEKDKQTLKLDNFLISQLSMELDKSQLKMAQVEIKNPDLTLTITEQKQLSFLTPLLTTIDGFNTVAAKNPENETAHKEKATESTPITIDISKLILTEPGKLALTDNSVTPAYHTNLTFNQIKIQNISSSKAADFKLSLKQGEYTTLDITGNALLFDPTRQLKLAGHIKQLDLPPVTPYTSKAMGYGMKSGVVDSDIELKIEKREIDSVIDLKIDSVEVVETQPDTAQQVSSASGMSIDLALSTLKDKNNMIELKLPIAGNLDKPDFDLNHIINKAMGKAMKSASLAYLKHTLQPFGSLITLFSLAKAAANHISLPPILFETNSLELKDQQQELLDKVLKVLIDRPGLKIKACGISALADQTAIRNALIEAEKERLKKEAKTKQDSKDASEKKTVNKIVIAEEIIQQKMYELADQRSAKVKAYFLEKGELDSSRILNCLSSSNTKEDSKPSVEMQI